MLSDVCHEFCSNVPDKSNESIRAGLDGLKSSIDHYRTGERVIKYDPRLFELLDKNIEYFEQGKINGAALWTIVANVVAFLDGTPELTYDTLFETCGFTPST